MKPLLETLMERDDLTQKEAQELINEMNERMHEGEDPEELLYEIGLEPDYVFDLIF
jgi:anthranilate phosphoribosyltransferase